MRLAFSIGAHIFFICIRSLAPGVRHSIKRRTFLSLWHDRPVSCLPVNNVFIIIIHGGTPLPLHKDGRICIFLLHFSKTSRQATRYLTAARKTPGAAAAYPRRHESSIDVFRVRCVAGISFCRHFGIISALAHVNSNAHRKGKYQAGEGMKSLTRGVFLETLKRVLFLRFGGLFCHACTRICNFITAHVFFLHTAIPVYPKTFRHLFLNDDKVTSF